MIDPTEADKDGMDYCRKMMGEILAEIGWDVPPKDWTPEQAGTLVEAIVTAWDNRPPF